VRSRRDCPRLWRVPSAVRLRVFMRVASRRDRTRHNANSSELRSISRWFQSPSFVPFGWKRLELRKIFQILTGSTQVPDGQDALLVRTTNCYLSPSVVHPDPNSKSLRKTRGEGKSRRITLTAMKDYIGNLKLIPEKMAALHGVH
jgi:hypothetical protein